MVEVIKHTLGICGEHWHPNLLNIGVAAAGFTTAASYIKYKIKNSLWEKNQSEAE